MSDQHIRSLLGNKHFQATAAHALRARGVEVAPGENPGAMLLYLARQENPQQFPALVAHYAPIYDDHSKRVEGFAKLEAKLPAAKVVEAWKALPKSSRLRADAKSDPRFDAKARSMGLRPLPGLSAGETLAAYLHAVHSDEGLRSDAGLAEIAEVTRGHLDAKQLRRLVDLHDTVHGEDGMVDAVGDRQKERDAAFTKANAKVIENPTFDPKKPPKDSIESKATPHKSSTRDGVAEAFDRQMKNKPRRAVIHDRNRLEVEMQYRKAAGEGAEGIELGRELHKEIMDNARDRLTERTFKELDRVDSTRSDEG